MITQQSYNYAKLLYSLNVKEEIVNKSKQLLGGCSELLEILDNPVVNKKEKASVIDALFEKEIAGFFKLLCDNEVIGTFSDIIEAYEDLVLEHKNIMKAKLSYAIRPDDKQLEEIKEMLCNKYRKSGVFIDLVEDSSLLGGYILYVGNTEYDKSIRGALTELQKTLSGR